MAGNPNPIRTAEFLAQQLPRLGTSALGNPIAVRYPEEIDELLREMSDRQTYIREAVEAKLKADGLL